VVLDRDRARRTGIHLRHQLGSSLAQADTIPLSTTLNNVSVTFNGIAAPLLFVSGGQVNAQMPWNVLSSGTTGTVNVVVTRNGQASAAQSVQIGPFSPVFSRSITSLSRSIPMAAWRLP